MNIPTIGELRERSGMNRQSFSCAYMVPARTLQSWETECEASSRTCPDYVKLLLKRAMDIGFERSDLRETDPLEISEIRGMTAYSRPEFAKKYGIPLRNIQRWESGIRDCPEYLRYWLTAIVTVDIEYGDVKPCGEYLEED